MGRVVMLALLLSAASCSGSRPPADEEEPIPGEGERADAFVEDSQEPLRVSACNGLCGSSQCCEVPGDTREILWYCAATASDPDNCGGCGLRCLPDQVCERSRCRCREGMPCGDRCVDLDNDPDNCGGCGRVCPAAARFCGRGVCTSCEAAGLEDCGGTCARLQIDDRHCGSCGNACGANSACVGGVCVAGECSNLACEAGTTCCDHVLTRVPGCLGCADLRSDPFNCGGCGVECQGACVDGSCTCAAPWDLLCNMRCVDPGYDDDDCGSCGHSCNWGQTCLGGQCRNCEEAGASDCDGRCVRLDWDPMHCGDCDTVCANDEWCNGGLCERRP